MKLFRRNPFKMIGPWIGAGIGLIPYFSLLKRCWGYGIIELIDPTEVVNINGPNCIPINFHWRGLVILLFLGGVGFLIGWGVHSLIRRWKRR